MNLRKNRCYFRKVKENIKQVESESIKERRSIIEDFLSRHKIKIKNIPEEEEADESLDKISIFMGNKYTLIRPFCEQIKQKMNSGGTVKHDLKGKTQQKFQVFVS